MSYTTRFRSNVWESQPSRSQLAITYLPRSTDTGGEAYATQPLATYPLCHCRSPPIIATCSTAISVRHDDPSTSGYPCNPPYSTRDLELPRPVTPADSSTGCQADAPKYLPTCLSSLLPTRYGMAHGVHEEVGSTNRQAVSSLHRTPKQVRTHPEHSS